MMRNQVLSAQENGATSWVEYCPHILQSISLVVFCLVSACASAWAAPSISGVSGTGTISHGQSVTISGSSFGSKATATPAIWDDFEGDDVAGSAIYGTSPVYGSAWQVKNDASQNPPTYTSANQRTSRSLKSALKTFDETLDPNGLAIHSQSDIYYFTYWCRFSSDQDGIARSWKPWYIYPDDYDEPNLALGFWTSGYGNVRVSGQTGETGFSIYPSAAGDLTMDDIEEEWMRIEVYIVQSTPATEDGRIENRLYFANPSIAPRDMIDTTVLTRNVIDDRYGAIYIGEWYGIGGMDALVNIDDVYFDTTQARVEIGNASTWAACTMREIQIPTSWSASSIAVTVNQGSFASDATAYLYVVDSTGTVNSSGYEITFAEESPDPPTVTITDTDKSTTTSSTTITYEATEGTTQKWRIGSPPDDSNGTECTSPATITGLMPGANTVYIGASLAGVWGTDSITVNYILTRKIGGNPPRVGWVGHFTRKAIMSLTNPSFWGSETFSVLSIYFR